MKPRRWIFALLVVGLLGYEAYALVTPGGTDTISEIIWYLSKRPLIPFVLGFLMGHFFWQRTR